jgi:D-amino-acid oxidase
MDRRRFLQTSGALAGVTALQGCVHPSPLPAAITLPTTPPLPFYDAPGRLTPIRADIDRIFRITVCLRPFRADGPRLEVERVGDKLVVHNYGHGGSGWSLSWGSADVAIKMALQALDGTKNLAVIGCGAIGLTSAITAQRSGLKVTIYARERPPFVRSCRATGSWTPDSRIALTSAPASFAAQWEAMARTSFAMYQSYLGLPGNPVEWSDRYMLSDPPRTQQAPRPQLVPPLEFASYENRLADIEPGFQDMPAGSTPFPTAMVRRTSTMTFNIADYSRQLVNDFLLAGGVIETREFHTPQDIAALPQPVAVNCTGYAARQLWSDASITPVRGQIAWLIPQEGVNYSLYYDHLNVVGRRDGIVVQPMPLGDATGWNDQNEQPDRAEAEAGVHQLQALYARMQKPAMK